MSENHLAIAEVVRGVDEGGEALFGKRRVAVREGLVRASEVCCGEVK
jgi:hypothetical protein